MAIFSTKVGRVLHAVDFSFFGWLEFFCISKEKKQRKKYAVPTVSSTADGNRVELTRFKQSISAIALAWLKLTHVTDYLWKRGLHALAQKWKKSSRNVFSSTSIEQSTFLVLKISNEWIETVEKVIRSINQSINQCMKNDNGKRKKTVFRVDTSFNEHLKDFEVIFSLIVVKSWVT